MWHKDLTIPSTTDFTFAVVPLPYLPAAWLDASFLQAT